MTRVLFDASRLLFRVAKGGALTGIDRVVLAYGRWLRTRSDIDTQAVWTWNGRLWPVAPGVFRWLLTAASREEDDSAGVWADLLRALALGDAAEPGLRSDKSSAAPDFKWTPALKYILPTPVSVTPQAGDLYINVSHYGVGQGALLDQLAARGVRPVVMIHDLIPIRWPEFCTPGAAQTHRRRLTAALTHGALLIANSDTTAGDVARFAAEEGIVAPPICTAPLGLSPAFWSTQAPIRAARPYFVCVGTLEPRKNLAFLLSLWSRLDETLGAAAPRLVLVGRRGWENEAIIDLLERARGVRSLVHEVCDLADPQLAQLIAGARALLAPSFAEGFDLPAAEALALGTPVIASDIAVHRELASGATLIDPLDGPSWIAAIQAACREEAPRTRAGGPSWEAHFEIVTQALGWAGRA